MGKVQESVMIVNHSPLQVKSARVTSMRRGENCSHSLACVPKLPQLTNRTEANSTVQQKSPSAAVHHTVENGKGPTDI